MVPADGGFQRCTEHPDQFEPCVSCDWMHIRKDPANEWSANDLRALSTALGPQVLIVHMPPVPTLPWCSIDEQAGFTINYRNEIVIRTTGPLSPYTAMELVTALTAHIVHYDQQAHNQEGSQRT